MADLENSISGMNDANKKHSSQALIVQSYANSVKEQPKVDFSGEPHLAKHEKAINDGLDVAVGHADNYLNNIQPAIIQNIANIENYYELHKAVISVCPEGDKGQWLESLKALRDQSGEYETLSKNTASDLRVLSDNIGRDAGSFAQVVNELNAAVNGDQGVLAEDEKELHKIQSKIDGAIAGCVLSGLAIAGGAFMIVVGSVADFVTAGTSTPVVVGGIGLVAGGIGGEVGSSVALKNLLDAKADILTEESELKAEVKIAQGCKTGYDTLGRNANAAMEAATEMANAWNMLGSDLDTLIGDLDKGIQSVGTVRKLFLEAANGVIADTKTDIATIKEQMAGVQVIVAEKGQTVADAVVEVARRVA